NGLREKDLNLKIAKEVNKRLKKYKGVSTKMSRTSDKYLSLSQRTNKASKWGADYFLSIHINAGGGTGYEDYIYNGPLMKRTSDIRDIMHSAITKRVPEFRNRGKKKANFHVL